MDSGADDSESRVRRELARLGVDEASAGPVPAEVTNRIGAALRAASGHLVADSPGPAHSVRPLRLSRLRLLAGALGLTALVIAVVVGVLMLTRPPADPPVPGPTAKQITVSSAPDVPLPSRTADRP